VHGQCPPTRRAHSSNYLEEKIASSDIEVHHRDVLMWLQAIIPEDLIADSRASPRSNENERIRNLPQELTAALPMPNWRAMAAGFTPALKAARTRLALPIGMSSVKGALRW
jgi:hypothetical protein